MSKILFILAVVGTVFLIYKFVGRPYQITEAGRFENYKTGDTIFALERDFVVLLRPFKKGDVVLIKEDVADGEGIVTVVGVPGDSSLGTYYLPTRKEVGGIVPSDYYLIKLPDSSRKWAISESDIKYLLWFPLIKLRQINANVGL